MLVKQPKFATISDDAMKRYLRALWEWPHMRRGMSDIEDAEKELIRRGHKDYVDYCRKNIAPR